MSWNTVQKLGQIAGVKSRTLRYYDQIGLLRRPGSPRRATIYGRAEVDLLSRSFFAWVSLAGSGDYHRPGFDQVSKPAGTVKLLGKGRNWTS